MPRIRRHLVPRPKHVHTETWIARLKANASKRATLRSQGEEEWVIWNDPPPEIHGPLIYCKDVEGYRRAWEAARQRAADSAVRAADPVLRAKLDAALAEVRAAPLPWERGDWRATPEPDWEPGERLRKARELLGWPSGTNVGKMRVTERKDKLESMAELKAARKKLNLRDLRKKVQELGAVVRDEAFDDWLERCLVNAQRPDEWTQARDLYENYLKQAKDYGNNRADRGLSKAELATETRWGRMMGEVYLKRRKAGGNYYPVRLKRDA